jgi:cytochrome P450
MQEVKKSSLGEQFQPLSPEHLENPYPFYERAREQEPIFFSPLLNSYIVTRMGDVRAILSDADTFSSSNVMRPIDQFYPQTFHAMSAGYAPSPFIINADGDVHEKQRAPLTRMLSTGRVKEMEPAIRERANALVDAFIQDGHADLVRQFSRRLTGDVICDLCGIEPDDREDVVRGCDMMLEVISTRDEQTQAQAALGMVEFQKLLGRYVRLRRDQPGNDFISEISAALIPGNEPLTAMQEGELVQYVCGLLLAAHDGTADTISDGVKLLLDQREQWTLLCQQPELIPNAVEEIVRFSPPGYAFFRIALKEVTVGNEQDGRALTLPAGTQFLLLYASANHDKAAFADADRLDIQRSVKSRDHVGFGYGKHFCAGAPLGHKEVEIALEVLTQRIPQLKYVPEQSFERRQTLISRGLKQFEVIW